MKEQPSCVRTCFAKGDAIFGDEVVGAMKKDEKRGSRRPQKSIVSSSALFALESRVEHSLACPNVVRHKGPEMSRTTPNGASVVFPWHALLRQH